MWQIFFLSHLDDLIFMKLVQLVMEKKIRHQGGVLKKKIKLKKEEEANSKVMKYFHEAAEEAKGEEVK